MISHISQNGIYGLAAALWLASKYLEADEFMMLVSDTKKIWSVDVLLGRLVGGLLSRMTTSADEKIFEEMVLSSGNHEAVKVLNGYPPPEPDHDLPHKRRWASRGPSDRGEYRSLVRREGGLPAKRSV
jgi:hypothetical protein